jgi:hypothetical protein
MNCATVISPAVDGRYVAPPDDPELLERIADLEREIRQLRARVAALERLVGNAGEHSTDRQVVREKATYDWQG